MSRRAAVLVCCLMAAAPGTAAARPDAEAKYATKTLRLKITMPPPQTRDTVYWTIRVAKHRTSFRMLMYVRRTDGRWGPPVAVSQRTSITEPNGKRLAQLRFGARYNPGKGRLRYSIRIWNQGVPKRLYRRAYVRVRLAATYRLSDR